jgi:hypothetical protein
MTCLKRVLPSIVAFLVTLPALADAPTATHATSPITGSSVAPSTIERSGRMPGDPVINYPRAIRNVFYRSLTGGKPVTPQALFGRSLHPDGLEAKQGHTGDCYLIATMASYAQFHPEVIKSVFLDEKGQIRTSASGSAAARFFVKDRATQDYKPADMATYDGRAPVHDAPGRYKYGRLPFAKEVEHKIWGPMLEYTYTKFRNQQGGAARSTKVSEDRTGYLRTGSGGYPNHVMSALTGKAAETLEVDLHHENEVWDKLQAAQANDQVVVVGSTYRRALRERVRNEVSDGHLDARSKRMRFDHDRWVPTHAFSAWGDKDQPFVFEQDGVRMIRLRNPWGVHAPGGEGKDGIGVIPFKQFLIRFDRAWIGASTAED